MNLTAEGKLLRLRPPWSDGTRAIRFEPTMIPKPVLSLSKGPRINLLVYHGVFAPHACGRQDAVRRAHEGARHDGAAHAVAPASQPVGGDPATPRPTPPAAGYVRPRYYAWATLLERTFAVEVLACPDCGGEERVVIEKILRHLELPIDPPAPAPAGAPEWLPGFETATDWIRD